MANESEAAPALDAAVETTSPERVTLRRRFRHWRKTRPFWGGLLTMLGGVEIALIPLSAYKIILVSMSVTVATVTGIIIAILGLLMWLTPSQNKLYGLLAVLGGVVSFVTSNVGGFLLGGLLAIIGGALGFAWVVVAPKPAAAAESPAQPSNGGDQEGRTLTVSLDQLLGSSPDSAATDSGPADPS